MTSSSISTDSSSSIFDYLQDSAQYVLTSGAAVLSDLQQQLAQAVQQQHQEQQDFNTYSSSYSSNRFMRQLLNTKEEVMAHLRWSTPLLQPTTHLPLPTVWDARTILAFVDCLRSIQHSFVSVTPTLVDPYSSSSSGGGSSSSSAGSYLTIPPVTAALVSALLLVFTRPGGVALRDVALSPFCVIDKKEYGRLLSCHLVHLDAAHLLTNLSALMPDCASLEASQGSLPFALDLLLLGLASSCAYVAAAVLHKELLGRPGQYYSMVTVGASSLGFALKVWAGCSRRSPEHHLLGLVSLPSQFSWVPNLALTHLLVPQASFTAHMAGVCAGLCRAYAVQPVLTVGWHLWRCITGSSSSGRGHRLGGGAGLEQQQQQPGIRQQQQQPLHTWRQDQHRRFLDSSSATDATQSDVAAAAAVNSSSSSSSGGWAAWLWPSTEVLLQFGCVGAAVGVYLACSGISRGGGGGAGGSQGRGYYTSSSWWRQ